eukprot:TRINITY_DN10022_c1_g1_i1.p1 TRINITY_DN10022_c1_g1~~TRINITY_DN10022_c1_g1_i1.p1  ORF type:complete len:665 (-),score=65.53 TRINITY_DN10022_c1_g1_i1:198-2162(-)
MCQAEFRMVSFAAKGTSTSRTESRFGVMLRSLPLQSRHIFLPPSRQSHLGEAMLGCAVLAASRHIFRGRRHVMSWSPHRWSRCAYRTTFSHVASTAAFATLSSLGEQADPSWLRQLSPDPETDTYAPNKECRQVRSGHYVRVEPTPLQQPELIIHSPAVAEILGISKDVVDSDDFTAFFSGDQSRLESLESWCTPYALSIMGQRQNSNCPFGNGNGYGDGRAISVGEVLVAGQRWEMQLKGAGTTPFCRRFDGRAVLRSSIREFLASEAMHNLGVETTRALSLVVSRSEGVRRQWYGDSGAQTVVVEPCAITTRVAPSFLRVGHIDLFARRVMNPDATQREVVELTQIVEHALFREYPDVAPGQPFKERAVAMLEEVAEKLSAMVAGWLRVGFCQGNFNADNCLIGGRTMDYGPFGWMDKYDPLFAKWVGSGQHYAFLNQPGAALANYHTLVTSVAPLLGEDSQPLIVELLQKGQHKFQAASREVFYKKMGFANPCESAASLWEELEPLMRRSAIDYTIFWRQLAVVAEQHVSSDGSLVVPLMGAFYEEPSADLLSQWASWLKNWLSALDAEEVDGINIDQIAVRLRAVNPKYIPREWMLVTAYNEAMDGDFSLVHELHALFLKPYDEQPEFEAKYYRRAPDEALSKGGVAYMS